jgi:hypothetical protein
MRKWINQKFECRHDEAAAKPRPRQYRRSQGQNNQQRAEAETHAVIVPRGNLENYFFRLTEMDQTCPSSRI